MTAKRDDSDRSDAGPRPDLTPTVSQVLRAVDEAALHAYPKPPAATSEEQKMSLFWRVFGGTLLSITALVAVTLFNNFSTSLSELRSELVKANEARAAAVNDLRADIARGADARADLIRKDEFNSRLSTNWTQVQTLQAQNNTQNATLTSLKTELDGLKDRLTRSTADTDAVRKDVLAVEAVRERLTTVTADLAAAREAVQKLRDEVSQNRAADNERKDRRDTLQKTTEDSLKELTKALGDCREKLARLEALVNPPPPTTGPPPPTPKK